MGLTAFHSPYNYMYIFLANTTIPPFHTSMLTTCMYAVRLICGFPGMNFSTKKTFTFGVHPECGSVVLVSEVASEWLLGDMPDHGTDSTISYIYEVLSDACSGTDHVFTVLIMIRSMECKQQ